MAYEFKDGYINPDALKQTEHWYDHDGNLHEIATMPIPYAKNVLAMLWEKGASFGAHRSPLAEALQNRIKQG